MGEIIKFPVSGEDTPLPTEEKMKEVLSENEYSPEETEEYRQMWQETGNIEVFTPPKPVKTDKNFNDKHY